MVAGVDAFLKRHRRLALDTSVFIYFVEQNSKYHGACDAIFRHMESGALTVCTSTLTLLEVLVGPYRQGNEDLAMKFYALLSTYPNLAWLPLSNTVADLAAKFRADHRLKTPDAIQAATAVHFGATGFICNDAAFRRIGELECLILEDLVK